MSFNGRVAAVAVVVGAVVKSSEKAIVKRFGEKTLQDFVRLEKMVSVFYLPPAILKGFLRRKTQNFAVK